MKTENLPLQTNIYILEHKKDKDKEKSTIAETFKTYSKGSWEWV